MSKTPFIRSFGYLVAVLILVLGVCGVVVYYIVTEVFAAINLIIFNESMGLYMLIIGIFVFSLAFAVISAIMRKSLLQYVEK